MIGGYISSAVLAVSGLGGIVIPENVASVLATTFTSSRGRSEFRIVYGAIAALGIAALVIGEHAAFVGIGAFWLGAAVVRILVIVVDRPTLDAAYWAYLAMEIVFGLLAVLGS